MAKVEIRGDLGLGNALLISCGIACELCGEETMPWMSTWSLRRHLRDSHGVPFAPDPHPTVPVWLTAKELEILSSQFWNDEIDRKLAAASEDAIKREAAYLKGE